MTIENRNRLILLYFFVFGQRHVC